MVGLHERLRLSITERTVGFEDQVQQEIARAARSGAGIIHALELLTCYAKAMRRQVELSWNDAPTDEHKLAMMRDLMRTFRTRLELFDAQFSRGLLSVPKALTSAVERECARMGLEGREAVLTIGANDNFGTLVVDLKQFLFADILVEHDIPPYLDNTNLVLIALPAFEGTRPMWQPIVIGHELAHYLQTQRPITSDAIDLASKLNRELLAETRGHVPWDGVAGLPRSRVLEQVATRWLNELLCDAYAVHRFGAAGVAAIAEFLDTVSATYAINASHPPGALRASLMLEWLGLPLTNLDELIVAPFRGLTDPPTEPDWAGYLCGVFTQLASDIRTAVETWAGEPPYKVRDRVKEIRSVADQLNRGLPGIQTSGPVGSRWNAPIVEPSDVINAAWVAMHEGSDKPVDRLTLKALDTLDFLQYWTRAGGELLEVDATIGRADQGVLSDTEIMRRIRADEGERLVVVPELANSIRGASIDLRLGNRFIVFVRFAASAFDSLDPVLDPRTMQSYVEKSWGDTFYLHPGEMVLASTLEYLALPGDLSAQVITRSSYGRLGMISATAVQVHPLFSGCLTLELINLGQMPMALAPGERIAQLMLFTTSNPATPLSATGEKYSYPTGPEFSKIRRDPEGEILRRMRDDFGARFTAGP